MSQSSDQAGAEFEHWLGAAIKDLRPAEGPQESLAGRIASIPAGAPGEPSVFRFARAHLVPLVAAGAGIAAVVLAAFALQRVPVPSSSGGVPSTFDPTIEGPGIVTAFAPTLMYTGWAVAATLAGVAIWWFLGRSRGSPRSKSLIAGLGLLIALAVTPLFNVDLGLRSGTVAAVVGGFDVEDPPRPFDNASLWYETANPGQPTTVMFSVRNEGPLPLRVDGIIGEVGTRTRPPVYLHAAPWRAVWLPPSRENTVVAVNALRPFTPTTIAPGEELQLYLVGRAGPCAYGSTYQLGVDVAGHVQVGTVFDVVVSTFGLSTSVPIQLPFALAEPIRNGCTG